MAGHKAEGGRERRQRTLDVAVQLLIGMQVVEAEQQLAHDDGDVVLADGRVEDVLTEAAVVLERLWKDVISKTSISSAIPTHRLLHPSYLDRGLVFLALLSRHITTRTSEDQISTAQVIDPLVALTFSP